MLNFMIQWREDFLALIASKQYTVAKAMVTSIANAPLTDEVEAGALYRMVFRFMIKYETFNTTHSGVEGLYPDTVTLRSLAQAIYRTLPEEYTLGDFTSGDYENGLYMLGQRGSFENGGTLEGLANRVLVKGMVFRGRTNNKSMTIAVDPSNQNVFEFFYSPDGGAETAFKEDFAYPNMFDLESVTFAEEESEDDSEV